MLLKVYRARLTVFVADDLLGELRHHNHYAFKKIRSEEGTFITIAWDVLECG